MSDSTKQCDRMCPYYYDNHASCVKAMQNPKRELDRNYIANCVVYIKLIKG